MTTKTKAAPARASAFDDDARYRIEVGSVAQYSDQRFVPKGRYIVKGKVANAIAASISKHEPV